MSPCPNCSELEIPKALVGPVASCENCMLRQTFFIHQLVSPRYRFTS